MTCPICSRPSDQRYRPFCSRRCADVDLARWLNGSYSIPAEEEDAPEEDSAAGGLDNDGAGRLEGAAPRRR